MEKPIITVNNVTLDKTKLMILIYENKKVQAIKYIKDHVNLGLKESKEIVDNLESNPNFYGDDIVTTLDIKDSFDYNVATKNKTRARKGSHVIKKDASKTKNMIIFVLGLIILFLLYFILNS